MEKACVMCRAELTHPATGRPRMYCSTACRRAAEYELRRLQALMLMAEKEELRARSRQLTEYRSDALDGLVRFWVGETLRLRTRLQLLLAGEREDARGA